MPMITGFSRVSLTPCSFPLVSSSLPFCTRVPTLRCQPVPEGLLLSGTESVMLNRESDDSEPCDFKGMGKVALSLDRVRFGDSESISAILTTILRFGSLVCFLLWKLRFWNHAMRTSRFCAIRSNVAQLAGGAESEGLLRFPIQLTGVVGGPHRRHLLVGHRLAVLSLSLWQHINQQEETQSFVRQRHPGAWGSVQAARTEVERQNNRQTGRHHISTDGKEIQTHTHTWTRGSRHRDMNRP